MVARVAGDGQSPALDRVREDHAWPVLLRVAGGERTEQRTQVMPGQVGDQGGQLVVGQSGTEPADLVRGAVQESGPDVGRGQAEQRLVVLVGQRVDPVPQGGAAGPGEGLLEGRAVLRLHDVPASRGELLLPLGDAHPGHHPVQRLPVQVHDPHDVAEPVRGGIGDRLPDVALVQFGVADQGDEPAARPRAEVGVHVPAGRGGEQRRGRAQPDGPGGEVRAVRVLGPARVGLQAAERAERRQVAAVQAAEQVLDRVVHRGGVRLHADLVRRVQVREVQRGHHADQAGAGGLVPAHLDAVPGVAVVIGRVHDPGGQPQDPLLDLGEDVQIDLFGTGHGHDSTPGDVLVRPASHPPSAQASPVLRRWST